MSKVEIDRMDANESVYGTSTCWVVWIVGKESTLKSFSADQRREAEAYAKYLKRFE
ncbi:hypothetical protein [Laceyella putida]|uniref:Uncharacterized protein n=1 Tax=Laceyella putida TaxID=110101 RepID=A0ABW2RQZ3_9BACL